MNVMAAFSMRYVVTFMRMFAEILTVAQAQEKTERMYNSKELGSKAYENNKISSRTH